MGYLFASGNETANASDGGIWDSSTLTQYASAAFTGDYGFRAYAASSAARTAVKNFAASGSTSDYCLQFRFNIITAPSGNPRNIWAVTQSSGGTAVLNCAYYTSGGLHYVRMYDGVPTQLGGDYQISLNTWYLAELTYVFSTRAFVLYLNGASAITGNANATYDNWGDIRLGWYDADTADIYFDDVVLATGSSRITTGADNGLKVSRLWPAADGNLDSDEAAGTTSPSGAMYSVLDETPPNDATDYGIFDAVAKACPVTLYSPSTIIPDGNLVKAVLISVRNRRGATGNKTYVRKVRGSSGTWSTVDAGNLTTNSSTWQTNGSAVPRLQGVSETNPDGGAAWTRTALDSAQISARCTVAAALWLSTIWAEVVHYTPAATGRARMGDGGEMGGASNARLLGAERLGG